MKRQQNPVNPFAPQPRPQRTIGDAEGGEGGGEGGSGGVFRVIAKAVATLGPLISGLWSKLTNNYTAENGGEVRRQFELTGQAGKPWANSYMAWAQEYNPHNVWNTGDIWDFPDTHPTPWKDIYDSYVAAGAPEGVLLDANMKPKGLDEIIAATNAQTAVTASAGPVPNAQQLATLQIWALQIAGAEGPQAAQQAAALVAQQPLPWQNYVNALVGVWRSVGQASESQGGGSTGGGPGPGPGPDAPKDGTQTVVLAAVAAKLLGLF